MECAAECLSSDLIQKVLGCIGVFTALVLTWGRANWEVDEVRSMLLGGVVTATGIGLAAAWWIQVGGAAG